MRKDEYKNIYSHQKTLWWYKGMAYINSRLLSHFTTKKTNSILDAGCGTGAALGYLSKFGDVVGVDVSEEALVFAKKIGNVKKADIINMPFKEKQFDVVTCMDVLYHRWVGDYRRALKEFHRVLKPNGILLLREPAYNWMRGSHDKVDFTKHRFNKAEIEQEMARAGFKIRKITYANFFLFPIVLVKRIPQMLIPTQKPISDMQSVHPFIDHILFAVLRFEASIIDWVSLPWGSSLLCVAERI